MKFLLGFALGLVAGIGGSYIYNTRKTVKEMFNEYEKAEEKSESFDELMKERSPKEKEVKPLDKKPITWKHKSEKIGHAKIENRDDGIVAFCSFDEEPNYKEVLEQVNQMDIDEEDEDDDDRSGDFYKFEYELTPEEADMNEGVEYILQQEYFEERPDFIKSQAYFYEDEIVTDDCDDIIGMAGSTAVTEMFGSYFGKFFEEHMDVIYVRNYRLQTDYEIIRVLTPKVV
jgi:hypothetical protein